jgi:tRNA (mo5U34)-methyltransferase
MIDFSRLMQAMSYETALAPWMEILPAQLKKIEEEQRHGDFIRWQQVLDSLPQLSADQSNLASPFVSVSSQTPLDDAGKAALTSTLKKLHPWRKGPYNIHGVEINTEWRSDWKWERLIPHLSPLADRLVLDVGCGNGYHCWRMAAEGTRLVIGIDPTQLFLAQFLAIEHFLGKAHPVHLLPLGIESVPRNLRAFDTVFSMGVLYHRRSPIDHLLELKGCLRQGGELVLETLVIEGGDLEALLPGERYAKMRNVWFIPSPRNLVSWLERCGFTDVRVVDVNTTSMEEQRATEWMQFESLSDYLDPEDRAKTVEGYPAPRRAIVIARSP